MLTNLLRMKKKLSWLFLLFISTIIESNATTKEYVLWYNSPAPNQGKDYNKVISRGFPYDEDWERWSLALGNGYMGAAVFGRTDTERIQLSEKTLGNGSCYHNGGFTNFAEFYIDFNHNNIQNYKRTLRLNDAISTVNYDCEGIHYSREYFANYPSNVIAIHLTANRPGALSFAFRGEIPYLHPKRTDDLRTGKITVSGNTMTLTGVMEFFNLPYESQVRIIPKGGTVNVDKDSKGDSLLTVQNADSAIIFIAAGTSYVLNENVFLLPPLKKCNQAVNKHPHKAVTRRIEKATQMGFEKLKTEHVTDYQKLFNRVDVQLSQDIPNMPTDKLIEAYQKGEHHRYLEELFFQYGRYLLIASSRKGALPPNLQGAWTQYDYSPWSGGYWHNVNIQMNYWHAFNTNLAELFEPFVLYNEAYRKSAQKKADEYIRKNNPEKLSEEGDNGWTIGCGANAFNISAPGGHSGPGCGGFTTKLFWDYYDFTRNENILKEHTYPAVAGMAEFLLKTLKDDGNGHMLVDPSYSPENYHNGKPHKTIGCTFDQGMTWEDFNDFLKAAKLLKINNQLVKEVKNTINKLDPVHIGADGQLKEYREENHYSDYGDPGHRHISHLCTIYPGTLINHNTPEWLEAARIAMNMRGAKAGIYAGWPMAHRMNVWARLKDGNKAYLFFQILLKKGIFENLWGKCPPFQVDSSFGGTAGMAEMLLQSHEGYIHPLPALPQAWNTGSYKGLVARGNFVIDINWKDGKATCMKITARKGGNCKIFYKGPNLPCVKDSRNHAIKIKSVNKYIFSFTTKKDKTYIVEF